MHFPLLIKENVYNFWIGRSINLGIRIHIIPMITNNSGNGIGPNTQRPGCPVFDSTLIMIIKINLHVQ